MWRTTRYVVRANGYGPIVISLLLFGGAALIVLTDVNAGGFAGFVKYIAISSALLSPILVASACKPENVSAVELYNTVSYPFWKTILQYVTVNLLSVILAAVLVTTVTLILCGYTHWLALAALGIVNVISNSMLFGGISLWGTVLGRDSRIGKLLGLVAFILSLLIPFPEIIPSALYFYRVTDGLTSPYVWWISRAGYGFLGIVACILAFRLVIDVDRLMVGKQSRVKHLSSAPEGSRADGRWRDRLVFSRPLPILGPKSLGVVLYEALLVILDGRVPILVATMCMVFMFGTSLVEVVHGGLVMGVRSLATSPSGLIYFLLPFLPILLVDIIPYDRRRLVDQVLLTALSPREYLVAKAGGVGIAIVGLFLLFDIPVLLITVIGALSDVSYILVCHLGIIMLGVLPALIYVSVLSVLVGALAGTRRTMLIGGVMTAGYIVLLVATQNSVVGNVLFPTGIMATKTFKAQLLRLIGVIDMSLESSQVVMPLYCLLLPLLSATLQIALAWLLVGEYFKREVAKA